MSDRRGTPGDSRSDSAPSGRPALGDRIAVVRSASLLWSALLVAVVSILAIAPVWYLMREPFSHGGAGIRGLLDTPSFPKVMRTTVWLGVGSVIIATVLGTTLAWMAHALPRRRAWLGFIPLCPLVVPPVALVTGYAFMLNPSIGFGNEVLRALPPFSGIERGPIDVYTVPWMIVITGVTLTSLVYLFVRTSLAQLHQDLFDAAGVSGRGAVGTFLRVVLPLVRPAVIYGAMTVALLSLGQLTVPLLLGRQAGINVLSTEMFSELSRYPLNLGLTAAYGLPIVVIGIAFLLLQRVLLQDQSKYATGAARGARPLRESGVWAQAGLLAYGFLVIVLPLGGLVIVSLQPFWSKDIDVSGFTLENYRQIAHQAAIVSAMRNSFQFSIMTILVVLPLGYVCARQIYRRRNRLSRVVEVIALLPLGIPTVIFGIGFFLAFTVGPLKLYGESIGIVVVYTVIILPFVIRILLAAMINQGEDLNNAAAANGAGMLRRTFAVDLPLLRPALGNAAALVFVLGFNEFSASLFVRSLQTPVVGSAMYDLWDQGVYPTAAAMALVTCVITGLAVAAALLVGGRSAIRGGGPIA